MNLCEQPLFAAVSRIVYADKEPRGVDMRKRLMPGCDVGYETFDFCGQIESCQGIARPVSLFLDFMAEQAPHRSPARLCRMFLGKLYLNTVMTCFAERVNFTLLLSGVQHVVELLVRRIQRKFLCLLLT